MRLLFLSSWRFAYHALLIYKSLRHSKEWPTYETTNRLTTPRYKPMPFHWTILHPMTRYQSLQLQRISWKGMSLHLDKFGTQTLWVDKTWEIFFTSKLQIFWEKEQNEIVFPGIKKGDRLSFLKGPERTTEILSVSGFLLTEIGVSRTKNDSSATMKCRTNFYQLNVLKLKSNQNHVFFLPDMLDLPPTQDAIVTTRIITFLVGNP